MSQVQIILFEFNQRELIFGLKMSVKLKTRFIKNCIVCNVFRNRYHRNILTTLGLTNLIKISFKNTKCFNAF